MMRRVNEQLSADKRLSWWSRNYRQVNKFYAERFPASMLPTLQRGITVLVFALFAMMILTGIREL